jgi:hypothetical protein
MMQAEQANSVIAYCLGTTKRLISFACEALGMLKFARKLSSKNFGVTVSADKSHRFFIDIRIAVQRKSSHSTGCFYMESPVCRSF